MPLTILIDSATGSDTLASGAGPATALTGTAASTDGTGLVVTLDGSPDLTNVLTDGTHCIFVDDTTSNARNFSVIVGKDNTAKTVTVESAYAFSLTGKNWAIGGKRASLSSASSRRLVDTGATNLGDLLAGSRIRFSSGHTETISALINCRRSGTVAARFTIETEPGAATLAVFTHTANTFFFTVFAFWTFSGIRFRCTNATKTASLPISGSNSINVINCHADDSGAAVRTLVEVNGSGCRVAGCTAAYCTGNAIVVFGSLVRANNIYNCALVAIRDTSTGRYRSVIKDNTITACGTGIEIAQANTTVESWCLIANNTIHACTGDGINFPATSSQTGVFNALVIENNCLTENGGYGIKFEGTVTAAILSLADVIIRNNNFGTGSTENDLGAAPAGVLAAITGSLAVDPAYADVATRDFSVGEALHSAGWPTVPIGGIAGTGTRSYVTVGAAQAEPVAASAPTTSEIAAAVKAALFLDTDNFLDVDASGLVKLSPDSIGASTFITTGPDAISTGPVGSDTSGVTTLLTRVPSDLETVVDGLATNLVLVKTETDKIASVKTSTDRLTDARALKIDTLGSLSVTGTTTGTPTPTSVILTGTDLSSTDDVYNGGFLVPTSGAMKGVPRRISDYVGSTKTATVAAFPAALATGVTVTIIGRKETA